MSVLKLWDSKESFDRHTRTPIIIIEHKSGACEVLFDWKHWNDVFARIKDQLSRVLFMDMNNKELDEFIRTNRIVNRYFLKKILDENPQTWMLF